MKLLVIISLLVLGAAWHKCNAQALRAVGKSGGKTCSPITIFLKSKTLLESGKWAFCADLAMNKHSLPYSRLNGNLLKQYHGSTPLYGSFDLNTFVSVEGGAYLGVVARRAESMGELLLPPNVDAGYTLTFDSGLVSGLSFELEKIGRLRLRYNYGLCDLLSIDDRTIRTRRLDVGINFQF